MRKARSRSSFANVELYGKSCGIVYECLGYKLGCLFANLVVELALTGYGKVVKERWNGCWKRNRRKLATGRRDRDVPLIISVVAS